MTLLPGVYHEFSPISEECIIGEAQRPMMTSMITFLSTRGVDVIPASKRMSRRSCG